MKVCAICNKEYENDPAASVFREAGEWLAEEVWNDAGELCTQCLENRARLAMMYLHEHNT